MFVIAAALMLTGAADVQPNRGTVVDPAERRVCRVQETLGSITPRRVCRTVAQWAQIDASQERTTQRNIDHMNNHGASGLTSSPSNPN